MTNVNEQAAKLRTEADREEFIRDFTKDMPEDRQAAFREHIAKRDAQAAQESAPAADALPDNAPIPGDDYVPVPRPGDNVAPATMDPAALKLMDQGNFKVARLR